MKNKIHLFLTGLLYILCACSGSDGADSMETDLPDTTPGGRLPVSISVIQDNMSGVNPMGIDFEPGDKVGLYAVNRTNGEAAQLATAGNYMDNMRFTYNGQWTPDTPVYWSDNNTHADFYLLYPYRTDITDIRSVAFSLSTDQSDAATYRACDIMTGTAMDVAPTDRAVSITTRHAMSMIGITLGPGMGMTAESLAAADVKVTIKGVKTRGIIDPVTGTVTVTGPEETVTTLKEGNNYRAIIAPQTFENGYMINISVDGTEVHIIRELTFKSGEAHSFSINLTKDHMGLDVEIFQWKESIGDYGGIAE